MRRKQINVKLLNAYPLPLKGGVIENFKNQSPGGWESNPNEPVPPGNPPGTHVRGGLVIVSTKRLYDVSFR